MNKKLIHQLGQKLIGRRSRFDPHLAKVIRPLRHTLLDDGSMEVSLLAKLRDGGLDDFHLLLGERLVLAQLYFRAVFCQALPHLWQIVAQHRDTTLNRAFVIAVVEPLALAVVANLQIVEEFELRIQEGLVQGIFSAQFL